MSLAKLAKGLLKREAKAMGTDKVVTRGKKMLGDRRKKVAARREAAQKMMGQDGEETSTASPQVGGPLATIPISTSVSSIQQHTGGGVEEGGTETLEGSLIKIKSSVISVDSLLKGTYTLQQKQLADQKQAAEKVERKGDEADLEKGKKKGPNVGKLVPKQVKSLWAKLLDFFTGIILGWVAVKMIDFLPALKKFLPIVAGVIDGIVNTAMFLFEAFTTLVDWGYQLVSIGEKAVKGIFGEEGAEKFGIFMNNLKNLVAGFLVWKIIGKQIFETIVKNIKFVWSVAKSAIKFAAQAINWMTRGAAGNLAKGAWQSVKGLAGKGISAIGSKIGGTGAGKVGSSILKRGALRGVKRASIKFLGKGATKAFGRIPIIGPIITAVISLMSGEPLSQALFKAFGAALGGFLGSIAGVAVTGALALGTGGLGGFLGPLITPGMTILGEMMGVFLGDMMYDLILGGGLSAAIGKLKDLFGKVVGKIVEGAGSIYTFFKEGITRLIDDFPTIPIPDIRPGDLIGNVIEKIPGGPKLLSVSIPNWVPFIGGWSVIDALRKLPGVQEVLGFIAQFIPGLNKYVEGGRLLKIPNLFLLTPFGLPFLIPHVANSFMPGAFPSAPSIPKGDAPVPKAVTAKSVKEKQKEIDEQKAKEFRENIKKKAGEMWEGAKKMGGNLMEGVRGMFAPKKEVIVSSHSHLTPVTNTFEQNARVRNFKARISKLKTQVEGIQSTGSNEGAGYTNEAGEWVNVKWNNGTPSIVKPSKSTEKLKSLESYASYEEGGGSGKVVVQVPIPVPIPTPGLQTNEDSGSGLSVGSGGKSPSPYMSLYRGDG